MPSCVRAVEGSLFPSPFSYYALNVCNSNINKQQLIGVLHRARRGVICLASVGRERRKRESGWLFVIRYTRHSCESDRERHIYRLLCVHIRSGREENIERNKKPKRFCKMRSISLSIIKLLRGWSIEIWLQDAKLNVQKTSRKCVSISDHYLLVHNFPRHF